MVNCPMNMEVTVPQEYWVIKVKKTGMYWDEIGDDITHRRDAQHFTDLKSARLMLEEWAPKGHSVVVRVRRSRKK
jgi:hypothetical protein